MLMKSRSLHNSTKNGFLIFSIVTWQPFMKHHSPLCFPSCNIMKNAETHPPTICDVIIKQPYQTIDSNVWGVVQQKIADLYQEKENWHIMSQILTLYFWIMGLTELKFDLTSWKYCTSKLTITSHNYLTNMFFHTECNNKSFLKFWR